ncbi:nucleotidyltransferase family protein [Mesorhizobium prunaredense]|uniref:nucleotidyltransferase family protein n=1 Tax=Mesorhizobium prunaredense TaxID=1631249 RepID=UPI00142D89E4|nr:nucleotidyltransferase family protein [Mesorhizobium prunaredense]
MQGIDELLCATLRGDNPPWPEHGNDEFVDGLLEQSAYHGVQSLLHHFIADRERGDLGWPKVILDACRQQATAQALWEMRHQYLLNQVLERLVAIGVHPILFKGTALAYDVYPAPFLRTRGDTDLLVPSDTRDRVAKALETLGFRELGTRADVISGQTSYSWTDPASNQEHTLDLHWRITNSTLLSNLFSYEELRSGARPLPNLSTNALAADPVHALVLACMHRAVHKHALYYVDGVEYYGGDRLIWFYDIQLLFSMLSPSQRNEFVELAERKGLRATCLDGIEATRARFHATIPEAVSGALSRPGPTETASGYLSGPRWYRIWMDFQAARGVRSRSGFLTELLFPPATHMRQKYRQANLSWLPWLYLRRALAGSLKYLRNRDS